jgi:flagellar export protein FliJ
VRQPAFRLEPVLRLRRSQERAASMAAAAAAREATAAARRAEEQAAALTTSRLPATASSGDFIAAMVASRTAAADVAAARALAIAHAEQAEVVRGQWTAAAQRTKGLERLRERHVARLQTAVDAAEARTVDDLVTRQHGETRRREEEETWRA